MQLVGQSGAVVICSVQFNTPTLIREHAGQVLLTGCSFCMAGVNGRQFERYPAQQDMWCRQLLAR